MMNFTYFENPLKFSPLKDGLTICDTCGQERICFDAELFYGEDEITAICPECLAGGKLTDRDIFTCQGDIEELQRQLQDLHPTWSDKERIDDAAKKSSVLEKTTPHLITWQDWEWPCADGDFCRFIGYGSKPLFATLAPGTDGEQLFRDSIYDRVEEEDEMDSFWANMVPQEAINDYEESTDYDTLFYVFKSLHSDIIVTVWDTN